MAVKTCEEFILTRYPRATCGSQMPRELHVTPKKMKGLINCYSTQLVSRDGTREL